MVLMLTASLAGCRTERTEPATTTPPAATAQTPTDETAIRTAVQAKFYAEDLTRGRAIDVSAQDGVVALRGTVPTEAARQQALTLARSVEGVTSVDDQLQVGETVTAEKAPGREVATGTAGGDAAVADQAAPAWITTKIQAQYFVDPDIKPWAIDVTTGSGGVVTLEGRVDSDEDKQKAVRIARETEGVTRVDDRLRVEAENATPSAAASPSTPGRPDAWITAKVQAKYFIDDDVKARTIDVTTQNGVVMLRGTVASEAEQRQAVALARNTDGVRDVTDQLRLDPALADDTRPAGADAERPQTPATGTPTDAPGLDRPDSWITMKVQAKYFLDSDVKGRQIEVDTKNGVVTLKGTVNTAQQKTEAEQIARETEGVKQVVNQLGVSTTGGI
jgi:osmotically-inducible protein OsmY